MPGSPIAGTDVNFRGSCSKRHGWHGATKAATTFCASLCSQVSTVVESELGMSTAADTKGIPAKPALDLVRDLLEMNEEATTERLSPAHPLATILRLYPGLSLLV